jgi:hypothetical protein
MQNALFRMAQWQAIPREVALGPLAEERRYNGLAVDEVAAGEGAEFSSCEEAGEWGVVEPLSNDGSVVPDFAKESLSSAVACDEEGGQWWVMELLAVKQKLQVFMRGLRVAEMYLHSLAASWKFTNCDGLLLFLNTKHISDDKVTASESLLARVNGAANEQSAGKELPLVLRQFAEHVTNGVERRSTVEPGQDIAVAFCDDDRVSNRSASLAHNGANIDVSRDREANRSGILNNIIKD